MKTRLLASALAIGLFAAAGSANAAKITLVNVDPAGQGLNDPTSAKKVGGNLGTTVGEQRRIVYQFAADLWGSVLHSDVETRVRASFQPLVCTETGGTLGQAGTAYINSDFPNAPRAGTIYQAALANALAGKNLNLAEPDYQYPDNVEIISQFNANLGGTNPDGTPCMTGSGWYYGLDGKAPAGQVSFLDVVLHEIGHGLGFSGYVGLRSGVLGERVGAPGVPDAYTSNAFDNGKGLSFLAPEMTDADRAAAIKTPGRLSWQGASVTAQTHLWLDPAIALSVVGGNANLATRFYGTAAFGPAATPQNFTGSLTLANDGIGDTNDACEPMPAGSLAGRVVFINRGTCAFEAKAANAQAAGASAVIIGNVASSGDPASAPGMADDAAFTATVPTISVNLADADVIRSAFTVGALPTAALKTLEGQYAGADSSGRALLYAPAVVTPGSSFSHFDSTLTPDALMEPTSSDETNGAHTIDLSLAALADIGWKLNKGNAKIGRCDTGVKLFTNPGILAGANIQAKDRMCRTSNKNHGRYLNCMFDAADELREAGLIKPRQQLQVLVCAAISR